MVINNLVEEVTADEASGAVDGSQGTLGVGPGFGGVVGDFGVSVLEVGDGNCIFG